MQNPLSSILLPYWLFIITRRCIVGLSCLFLYIESLQITPAQIGFCLSSLAISQILFEVPSGIGSDRLGRRLTLSIATAFRLLAWFTFAVATSIPWFILAFAFLGAAFAFDSGTDSAILFDTLKEQAEEKRYPTYESKSYNLGLIALGSHSVFQTCSADF